MQHIYPVVLKVNEEHEDNSHNSITITHHLEGSVKYKAEIISLDSYNELANAFSDSTDNEPKSEQTNKQQNENNEKNSYIQCRYLLKLKLYMIHWYLYWLIFVLVKVTIFTYNALKGQHFYIYSILIRVIYPLWLSYAFYCCLILSKSDLYVIFF